jgi:hypothetical protein
MDPPPQPFVCSATSNRRTTHRTHLPPFAAAGQPLPCAGPSGPAPPPLRGARALQSRAAPRPLAAQPPAGPPPLRRVRDICPLPGCPANSRRAGRRLDSNHGGAPADCWPRGRPFKLQSARRPPGAPPPCRACLRCGTQGRQRRRDAAQTRPPDAPVAFQHPRRGRGPLPKDRQAPMQKAPPQTRRTRRGTTPSPRRAGPQGRQEAREREFERV